MKSGSSQWEVSIPYWIAKSRVQNIWQRFSKVLGVGYFLSETKEDLLYVAKEPIPNWQGTFVMHGRL